MEKKQRILVVDDDPNIREVLSVLLGSEGYEILEAESGEMAMEYAEKDKLIELVILDIMMPGLSGVEVCAKLRQFSQIPVLFLTAKSQEQDKVVAYTEGGDDYLVKPFSQTELLMKVKSLLRRYTEYNVKATGKRTKVLGENIVINEEKRSVFRDEERVNLTDKEYEILHYFIDNRGKIVDAKELYEGVWGEKYLPSAANTIMVHVLNLRKKLEEDANHPQIIKTIWGKGYKVE